MGGVFCVCVRGYNTATTSTSLDRGKVHDTEAGIKVSVMRYPMLVNYEKVDLCCSHLSIRQCCE